MVSRSKNKPKKTVKTKKVIKKVVKKLVDLPLVRPPRIMLIAKQNKKGLRIAKEVKKELEDRVDLSFDPTTARRIKRLQKRGTSIKKFDGDFIITLGGDGTFLRAAHEAKVPILPVKIEGHGFLCTTTLSELKQNIDRLTTHNYEIKERIRIKCSKVRGGRFEKYLGKILSRSYPSALNEILFSRRRPSKILRIEFKIDDTVFKFPGDGLLFTTPSGSSGYSASAGGSLLDPELEVMGITPLYPFFSTIKPMIIPIKKKIELTIKGNDCAVIIDGHGGEYIKPNTEFIIEKGDPIKVIRLSEQRFYERFKQEFIPETKTKKDKKNNHK